MESVETTKKRLKPTKILDIWILRLKNLKYCYKIFKEIKDGI